MPYMPYMPLRSDSRQPEPRVFEQQSPTMPRTVPVDLPHRTERETDLITESIIEPETRLVATLVDIIAGVHAGYRTILERIVIAAANSEGILFPRNGVSLPYATQGTMLPDSL